MKTYTNLVSIIFILFFSLYSFANDLTLTTKDFSHAQISEQSIIYADLNSSGLKKVESLEIGQTLEIEVAGEAVAVVLKAKLKDKIQFGPFKRGTAQKIVHSINK